MEVIVTPDASTHMEVPDCINDVSFTYELRICPKCNRQKGLPVTHNDKPDAVQRHRIQRGELLWIRLSMLTNAYRLATNWKCIWCEFEWREQRGPFY